MRAIVVSSGKTAWTAKARAGRLLTEPSVDGPTVVVSEERCGATGTSVVAFDVASGLQRWTLKGSPLGGAAGGVMLVSQGGSLRGVSSRTGRTLWKLLGVLPLTAGPKLAFATAGSGVQAYDRATGELVWHASSSTVVTSDEQTVVLLDGATMRVVDATTGAERFAFTYSQQDPYRLTQLTGDTLATIEGAELVARDTRTGVERWRVARPVDLVGSSGALQALFVHQGDAASLTSLATTDGATRWVDGSAQWLAAAADSVLITDGSTLSLLDGVSGAPHWKAATGAGSEVAGAIGAGKVLVAARCA